MEKISQALVSKLNRLQRRFESILDNDFEQKVQENERNKTPFEPSRDPALVRGLPVGLPDDHIDRAIVAFSRLALMFDAGLLLENQDGQWRAQASFKKGHTQLLKNNSKLYLNLPHTDLLTVLKTNPEPILKKLQLTDLDSENRSSCLLLKVTPDFSFLLLSTMADPWLKEHMEQVRSALISGFAD